MNRICPSEEGLSKYISGVLAEEDKTAMEKHIAGCRNCRELLVETHNIMSRFDVFKAVDKTFNWVKKNRWLIGAIGALTLSFLYPRYFIQFLVACLIMGGKWIVDSKTTKMLIMIHEAWKKGDKKKTDKILSRFDSGKRG